MIEIFREDSRNRYVCWRPAVVYECDVADCFSEHLAFRTFWRDSYFCRWLEYANDYAVNKNIRSLYVWNNIGGRLGGLGCDLSCPSKANGEKAEDDMRVV